MSSSASLQKRCIQIVLLITWNIWVSSGNGTDLRFWPGCRAVIPCQSPTFDSDSFKWFYNEFGQSKEIQLYSEDRSGVRRYDASRRRVNITNNRSLVINHFTEGHQGIYWCEICKDKVCSKKQSIRVHKEIRNETQKIFFITAGRNFTQTCSDEFSDIKWIFETNKTKRESENTVIELTKKVINIASVKSTDAGTYTCWVKRCGGLSQRLLTVNLCVIKVFQNDESSFSCAVTCDAYLNIPKNTSSFPIDHTNISLDVDPSGSLICNASQSPDLDGYTTVSTTYISSTEAAGESGKPKHLIPVFYGISAVIVCLVIITFLIFCLRSRSRTAFPFCFSCCGFSDEEEVESTVIYSSIVIKTPADKIDHGPAESDCLYSEIKI